MHIRWMAQSFAGQIVFGKTNFQGPLAPCLWSRTRTRNTGNGLFALQSEPRCTAGAKDSLPFGTMAFDMRLVDASVVWDRIQGRADGNLRCANL